MNDQDHLREQLYLSDILEEIRANTRIIKDQVEGMRQDIAKLAAAFAELDNKVLP